MRILVCGGRDYTNEKRVFDILREYRVHVSLIISGKARGADTLAERWAILNDVKFKGFPANWTKHGNSAGPIRNRQMIEEGHPDLVIAFKGGNGTANMIKQAKDFGIAVRIIEE